ncbi:hypothetical protein Angca_001867, partial [Angiostrongylus cantonensis]
IQATILKMTSGEIILNFHYVGTDFAMNINTCPIDDDHMQGCYKCAKGALVHIK